MNKDSKPAMINISIIPKTELPKDKADDMQKRVEAPEHNHDRGPCTVWNDPGAQTNLFVAVDARTNTPIGILHRGGEKNNISAGWWMDSSFRGKGYGTAMVSEFARMLKKKEGVTGVSPILIDSFQGQYNEQSAKLATRFKEIIYSTQ